MRHRAEPVLKVERVRVLYGGPAPGPQGECVSILGPIGAHQVFGCETERSTIQSVETDRNFVRAGALLI